MKLFKGIEKKGILTFLLLFSVSLGIKAQGIEFFHGSFEEAKMKAKTENKPLFVDVYTSWCGPCKKLSKEVFPQKIVGDYFNKSFVCFKLQADKKDSNNQEIANQYHVTAYPTLMWLDGDGKLLHVSTGFKVPQQLVAEAKVVFDENRRVGSVIEKWHNGDRSLPVALKYFAFDKNSKGEFDSYFNGLTEEQKLDSLTFKTLAVVKLDLDGEVFKYLVQHRKDYQKVAWPFEIARAIDNKIDYELQKDFGTANYQKVYKKYQDMGFADLDQFSTRAEWMHAIHGADLIAFENAAKKYIQKFSTNNPGVYGELIWRLWMAKDNLDFSTFKERKILLEWVGEFKKAWPENGGVCFPEIFAHFMAGNIEGAKKIGNDYLKLTKDGSQDRDFLQGILKSFE
ncbi:thioredoxin family protein [Marinifilum fragile]|uniref:thioredoxin family protein n=1 Tax=Marinifilum fragile TaxID=570161 RepID=UPI002AA7F69B|nr:thioredoxin family protein [Marinifilum fragile]